MVSSTGMNPYMADAVKVMSRQAQSSVKGIKSKEAPADPKDTVTLGVANEPIISDNEHKWLNMIGRENITRDFRNPAVWGITAAVAGGLGFIASIAGGPGTGLTVATAVSGLILGTAALNGISEAQSEKKEWKEIFAEYPESSSREELRDSYLDIYLKATKNGLA